MLLFGNCCEKVVCAGKRIRIYFTQMSITKGLRIESHDSEFYTGMPNYVY